MALTKIKNLEIVKNNGKNEKDSGHVAVQIALLTEQIEQLTNHLLKNKKDFDSKRGLFKKVSQRKSLLKYYQSLDIEASRELQKKLKIR